MDHYAQYLTRTGDIVVDQEELDSISKEAKEQIIKDYMKTYYHYTVGLGSFIVGILAGVLIK